MSFIRSTYQVTAQTSVLAQTAALLSAGQSILLPTDISKAALEPENSPVFQWAISAAYDSLNKKVHFIGKRDGPNFYHWVIYDIATNHWSISTPSWSGSSDTGHGYDHNTADTSGNFYHAVAPSNTVRKWNGTSWSALADWTQNNGGATGGLTWTPWNGGSLYYNDGIIGLIKYNGSTAWDSIPGVAITGSYHDFSEYNSTANVLILGGGNGSSYYKYDGTTMTSIADPSAATGLTGFRISANAGNQGICCSDPNSAKLIAYYIETGLWAEYNINTDTWTQLTQSTGSGATPQNGLPNIGTDPANAIICVTLPGYNCTMWLVHPSSGNLLCWLYRHT